MGMTRSITFSSHLLSRRAALFAAAALIAGCASARPSAKAPTRVLFVCQYGTVKSAIAREEFRRLAAARGLNVRVDSRGISPEDHISPALAAAVARDGLDIRSAPVRALAASDLSDADIIVVFDALPEHLGRREVRDWSDLPSMNADYAGAHDILVGRINALLDEIARR